MESLGHYLLRDRIALPGQPPSTEAATVSQQAGGPFEVFEGQDVRTGISILVFKPMPGPPPELHVPGTLPWTQVEENAWVTEIPVGAVQTSWLAGRVEPARLLTWSRQLLEAVHTCQVQNVPVGWIVPELVWARGSKIWLAGAGVAAPEHPWDYAGLLNTLRTLAADTYPALPWREALEAFVTGGIEYETLRERLEAAVAALGAAPASLPVREFVPSTPELPREEPPSAPSDGAAAQVQEEPATEPRGGLDSRPVSKSLKVQIGQEELAAPEPAPPPKRIRIEESLSPPFEVLEPLHRPLLGRGAALALLIFIPLMLLLAGGYYFLQSKPSRSSQTPTSYTVEFRLQPPGPKASIEVLEVPEGSKIPLNTVLAEVPGQVKFDVSGIYRIRVRVQGRAPVDSIISVPNPGGVNINLR